MVSGHSDNININRVKFALALLYYKNPVIAEKAQADVEAAINKTDSRADRDFETQLVNEIKVRFN